MKNMKIYESPTSVKDFSNNDIQIYPALNQSLPELLTRFQGNLHEEILSVVDGQLKFILEELPKYLRIRNIIKGIIVQLNHSKNSSEELCQSFERRSTSTPVKVLTTPYDLDVTGSPLKCPFAVNNDDAEFANLSHHYITPRKKITYLLPSYNGLDIILARNIASKLLSALKITSKQGIATPPIWIACNSQDVQRTAFLGIYQDIVTTLSNVTCSGPHNGLDNLPTIDHLNTHFCFACPNRRAECTAEALYDVYCSEGNNGSSVHVSSSWKRPLFTLSPPALDAVTFAQVHIDPSDSKSEAHHIFEELALLEDFILGLETCEGNWVMKKEELSVSVHLKDYFKTIVMKAGKGKSDEACAKDFDKITESEFFKVRQNMEFTDQLWSILKKSGSNCELQNAFKETFEAISTGTIRPQIQVKNKTKVAERCRNLMRGFAQDLDLSGLTALEMLIELGLEKIKRDYISIFQVCELATGEQLQPFINWSVTQESYKNCLNKLKQIHIALQVVVVLKQYLKLPFPVLAQCTAQVLIELGSKKMAEDFSFPLQTSYLTNLFESLSPALWKLSMSCQTEAFQKFMDFYIKRDFDYFSSSNSTNIKEFELLLQEKEKEDLIKYFCLTVTSSADEFFM